MQNEDFNEEKTILEGLKFAIGLECKECGHINSGDATQCEECGFVFPEQAEDKHFSYKQEVVSGMAMQDATEEDYKNGLKAIPLEESENLLLLQETVQRLSEGEITEAEYRQNITKVYNIANIGVELFKTKVFVDTIAKLPPDQKQLATESSKLFTLYAQGCKRMLEFDGSSPDPALEGLEMAEQALTEMDRLQHQAIEIAEEEIEEMEQAEEQEESPQQ